MLNEKKKKRGKFSNHRRLHHPSLHRRLHHPLDP
jgi:hypothetical protein